MCSEMSLAGTVDHEVSQDFEARWARITDDLGEADTVVGEEDNLERITDLLVLVDDLRDGVDEPDGQLGDVVARSGLSARSYRDQYIYLDTEPGLPYPAKSVTRGTTFLRSAGVSFLSCSMVYRQIWVT